MFSEIQEELEKKLGGRYNCILLYTCLKSSIIKNKEDWKGTFVRVREWDVAVRCFWRK